MLDTFNPLHVALGVVESEDSGYGRSWVAPEAEA